MVVFISHVSQEGPLAAVLKHWIESAFLGQVDVFVSSEISDISAGDQWFHEIESALADTKVVIVICSSVSVQELWISFEAGAGWIKGVPVLPICHSGMTKGSLPTPLSFFQGLDAGAPDFTKVLVTSLTKQLGFPREPLIPHENMTEAVRIALSEIVEHSGDSIQTEEYQLLDDSVVDEELGFLDHLVVVLGGLERIASLIQGFGEHTETATRETNEFVEQGNRAQADKSQGSGRQLQKLARKYGEKLGAYARKLEDLNEEYGLVLPEVKKSLAHVIGFQDPKSQDDWQAVDDFIAVLDPVEESVREFKTVTLSVRQSLSSIPNFERRMRQAIGEIAGQYATLISNLDMTLEMIEEARALAQSLRSQ